MKVFRMIDGRIERQYGFPRARVGVNKSSGLVRANRGKVNSVLKEARRKNIQR